MIATHLKYLVSGIDYLLFSAPHTVFRTYRTPMNVDWINDVNFSKVPCVISQPLLENQLNLSREFGNCFVLYDNVSPFHFGSGFHSVAYMHEVHKYVDKCINPVHF